MGLKILHTADWHLDSPFSSLPVQAREKLRQAQRELPRLMGELCQREQCSLALLAGDIFDASPSRETVEALKWELARWEIPVCISPGNHDFYGLDSPWRESWPENVHIFTGSMEYRDYPQLNCRVYGGGYRSMDCPPLLENFHAEGDARWCLGLLHGDGLNLSSPYCPVTAAQVRESGLDYLALGHIHTAGSFRAGDTLCAWPGCPMGRGWDETGEKGALILELDRTVSVTAVTLPLPVFYDFTVRVNRDGLSALETVLPPVQSPNLYRVTLTGQGSLDLEALKKQFSHLGYLELRDETEEETDPFDQAGEDSLRGEFFRILKQQLAEADPEQAELIRLAASLSARLLDGKEVTLP
ncbi:MAG: metallophosphoesterase [Firmicutes bacterium]|nr:metallophosphoesterase [Bacillota bacterium]MDY6161619.1 metallophosphoesterase [Candidatus Faecousia sp.]